MNALRQYRLARLYVVVLKLQVSSLFSVILAAMLTAAQSGRVEAPWLLPAGVLSIFLVLIGYVVAARRAR